MEGLVAGYRESARPEFCVGDRVKVRVPFFYRVIEWPWVYGSFSSWHGYEMTVRSLFRRTRVFEDVRDLVWTVNGQEVDPWEGERCAVLDVDDNGSIWMPLCFLERVR